MKLQNSDYAPKAAKYPRKRYGELLDILPVIQGTRRKKFLAKIDRSAGSFGCHPWRGPRLPSGYGLTQGSVDYLGYSFLAHRVAWAIARRREPAAALILHSCDNPPCCNPAHLRSGTHQDNTHDMIKRGRANYVSSGRPVDEDGRAEAIRLRFVEHSPMADIVRAVGRHRATISRWCQAYVRERERLAAR